MTDMIKYQYMTSLIAKKQLGDITPEEERELAVWLEEDERHRQRYERLIRKDFSADLERFASIDATAGWRKYKKRYHRQQRQYRWYGVAAMLLLLISLGTWRFIAERGSTSVETREIHHGTSKALLVLADGSERELEIELPESVIPMSGVVARHSGGKIRYDRETGESMGQTDPTPLYNTIKIPTGGEFTLELVDGTTVWLNSETTLRYPVNFTGVSREVWLDGEAYFEVVHDESHPFIVRTVKDVSVQVLGTSFNVRAYGDEENVEAVLEEGLVRLSADTANVMLIPGMMGIYNQVSGMRSKTVDTELYTAWHRGYFIFQDETLEFILDRLSRWYGMKVFYRDEEAKSLVFSGNVRKYETVFDLLKAMEFSGVVNFEVKGNTVVVSSK